MYRTVVLLEEFWTAELGCAVLDDIWLWHYLLDFITVEYFMDFFCIHVSSGHEVHLVVEM